MTKKEDKKTKASKARVIIGIDLGTTNSCVAVTEGRTPRVLISPEGTNTTPSVVAFKGSEELVGLSAKRQAVTNPTQTFFSVKRFMGRMFNEVQEEIKNIPYKVVKGKTGKAVLQKDNGDTILPETVSSKILAKMKSIAESNLGAKVTEAVITVPAYFDDSQRQATKEAADIIGLDVTRIISEPTAAAVAYGLDNTTVDPKTVVVFDLGGGTFDVSILEMSNGVTEVLSTSGDNHLGGDDFDHVIVAYLVKEFKKDTGIDLKKDKMALQRVIEAAEKAKIELSGVTSTEINLPFISMDSSGPKHFHTVLTRAQFENLAEDLIKRLSKPCKEALKDAKVKLSDISDVLPVGGMTRMPKVQDKIREIFEKEFHKCVHPDEVVAQGAAIQGAIISGDIQDMVLLDVLPLTVGIETKGNIFAPIIHKNTTIPTESSQVFSTAADNQTSVSIVVLQGTSELASRNKNIGQFDLTGIPPAPRGKPQIKVTFKIDSNGILLCHAKDVATGKENEITVSSACSISEEEIEILKKEAQEHEEEDKKTKALVMAKNDAESMAYQMKSSAEEFKDKIPEEMYTKVCNHSNELKTLSEDSDVTKEQLETATKQAGEVLQEIGAYVYKQHKPEGGEETDDSAEEQTNSTQKSPAEDIEV